MPFAVAPAEVPPFVLVVALLPAAGAVGRALEVDPAPGEPGAGVAVLPLAGGAGGRPVVPAVWAVVVGVGVDVDVGAGAGPAVPPAV